MLYKVTPMLSPPQKAKPVKAEVEGTDGVAEVKTPQPRKRRKSAVFDADGHEVLITMMCLKCKSMKPLNMFGLRKMADGAIRNQPWCRTCRSGASTKKKKDDSVELDATGETTVETPLSGETEAPVDHSVEPAPS